MDLWKTKTFWVGIVTVLAGLIKGIFDGNWSGENMLLILGGAGMITGRHAVKKLEPKTYKR